MDDKFFKYRSINGKIFEMREDGKGIRLTIGQARRILNQHFELLQASANLLEQLSGDNSSSVPDSMQEDMQALLTKMQKALAKANGEHVD